MDDYASGANSTPLPRGLESLGWKTKIADLLPDDWRLMDSYASAKVDVIDALSHVTGLPR